MKQFACIAVLFILALAAQAQQLMPATITKQVSITQPRPYLLVGSEEGAMNALVLHPDHIQRMDVLKGPVAIAKYGDKAKAGAVVMTLKNDTKLARLQEVYAAFKVPAQQQNLKIAIDDKLVSKPELLLAYLPDIARVEVKQQDVTAPARFSFDPDEPYLNIVTLQR
ncbi:hypothetical protein [Pontibacter liquoris]|uniref:hypothetical protein n=1 Tax=Pontibacter liquoris TaxID=2905677 RepID=UPI001FA75548|nr:hypothetical protein [Pontibacter liquoris]